MTRGRDVFWGALAAVLPLVSVMVYGNIERRLEQYMAHTFNHIVGYSVFVLMFVLMGIALFMLAVRFGSKPVETSRVPLIGLCVGVIYCVFLVLVFVVEYWMGVRIPQFVFQLTFYTHISMRFMSVAAFYVMTLIVYWKTHTFVPKEELQKEIEQ